MDERDLEAKAQEPEYVALTNDLLFHMVFTMNELALKSLLSSLLSMPEEQIQKIEILNPMQYNESFDTKLTVLDLKLHLNDDRFILVEMQVRRFDSWTNRTLLYACRSIVEQSRGEGFRYDDLQSVIQIAIMDHTLFPDHRRFFAKYELQDEEGYRFSDKLQFYVMDLKAIDEAEEHEKENGLVDWAKAFTAKDWKAVEKIDNPGVKEAQKTMEVIMSEPTQRQLIIDRRTALLDRQAELDDATRKGRAEGRAEGRVEILSNLVKDGLLSAGEAAKRMNMTEREFAKAAGLYLAH